MGERLLGVIERSSWVPFALLFLGGTAYQVRQHHADFGQWDVLLLSGWATLGAGLAFTQTVPGRLERTLHRLRDCGSIEAGDARLDKLAATLRHRARRWGLGGAVTVAAGVFLAFAAAGRGQAGDSLLWLEVFGGLLAGYELGRMSSYGSLGSLLKQQSCAVRVRPGHFDGAGGLKPVGDYYFLQAVIAGVPAAFLAAWWLLIPVVPRDYQRWRNPYLGLLVLAIGFELLCFFLPLWYFHREMERQKDEYLREADALSSQMAVLGADLAGRTAEEAKAARERVAAARERYDLIEEMPTWPVDRATLQRFRTQNLVLLLPVAAQVLGKSGPWQAIAAALSSIGS